MPEPLGPSSATTSPRFSCSVTSRVSDSRGVPASVTIGTLQPSGSRSHAGWAQCAVAPASTQKTREREAADAVAAGAYDKAARLYEDLAKAHPEAPAYAEAARIMKARAGKR